MLKSILLLLLLTEATFFVKEANAQEWSVSTVASSSALWPNSNLKDANPGSGWSSNGYPDAYHTEWVAYWFNSFYPVNYVKIFPRLDGSGSLGFPKDFNIYWSDGGQWNLARSYTNFETPKNADYVILPLPATVNANGIHIVANKLGADNFNNYYFQINEVGAGYNSQLSKLTYITNNGSANEVEVRNTGAGNFNPGKMKIFNYDKRNPIITANPGSNPNCLGVETKKNVYAPNVVYKGGNTWDVFFGGWDGRCPHSMNDTISRLSSTDNFASFGAHMEIISVGSMTHANNESVVKTADGTWRMAYTVYNGGYNKPAYASSGDGVNWSPPTASSASLITVNNYPGIWGDLNSGLNNDGSNVLYAEGNNLYFYWSSIPLTNGSGGDRSAHWASGNTSNPINFNYGGKIYGTKDTCSIINDVKKINGSYLFVYHCNGNKIWYSVGAGPTPSNLPALNELFDSKSPVLGADAKIATAGWVSNGSRLLGVLYGAGIVDTLDQNRIFARWLQKKLVIQNSSTTLQGNLSNGPDTTLVMMVPGQGIQTGILHVYDSDGSTLLYSSPPLTFRQGDVWQYNP